ncbi:hypothetical protein CVT24_004217 [Panaeolus cyanescens]|uniref:Uncharacterized protein n=1 Tax=Panaeolus cyanescens TaxID=181874 RepID=A0A409YSX1_9AGAR|nr:hypothetical protein CVT24_004217 [Panaeolus cyanescens]
MLIVAHVLLVSALKFRTSITSSGPPEIFELAVKKATEQANALIDKNPLLAPLKGNKATVRLVIHPTGEVDLKNDDKGQDFTIIIVRDAELKKKVADDAKYILGRVVEAVRHGKSKTAAHQEAWDAFGPALEAEEMVRIMKFHRRATFVPRGSSSARLITRRDQSRSPRRR